jgi:hypothetical protein
MFLPVRIREDDLSARQRLLHAPQAAPLAERLQGTTKTRARDAMPAIHKFRLDIPKRSRLLKKLLVDQRLDQ